MLARVRRLVVGIGIGTRFGPSNSNSNSNVLYIERTSSTERTIHHRIPYPQPPHPP